MATKRVPALEGFFREEDDGTARLLGGRCVKCGASFFPMQWSFCRNPVCEGAPLDEVELSHTGTLWSFADNQFSPPPPYPQADSFVPYGVAAVELTAERMVVLGQLASGTDTKTLSVGVEMELVVEPLYETAEEIRTVWKWKVADKS